MSEGQASDVQTDREEQERPPVVAGGIVAGGSVIYPTPEDKEEDVFAHYELREYTEGRKDRLTDFYTIMDDGAVTWLHIDVKGADNTAETKTSGGYGWKLEDGVIGRIVKHNGELVLVWLQLGTRASPDQ